MKPWCRASLLKNSCPYSIPSPRRVILTSLMRDTGFDEETAASILTQAHEEWWQLIDATIEAAQQNDWEKTAQKLHTLKGSAATLRAENLAQTVAEAESLNARKDSQKLKERLREIRIIIQKIEQRDETKAGSNRSQKFPLE